MKFFSTLHIPKPLGLAVLRWGLALVFLWFGINQLLDPYNYIGYLPEFLFSSPVATTFIYINGIFEIVASICLIIGFHTRLAATLLSLHLFAITFELGYGETAVRDFGLAVAALAIALSEVDRWTRDFKQKKKRK